ncbi:MAG: FMN-binding protein [Pygmaiobacter sp.]
MKKGSTLALAVLLALSLVACGGTKIKDGTYTAKMDAASAAASYGWTDTLSVTYQGGKITEVDFDSFDAEGKRKSETPEYPMTAPAPAEWMPKLEENIKATTSADKVAAVAGATNSSDNAKALYAAVQEAAKMGKTEIVEIGAAK